MTDQETITKLKAEIDTMSHFDLAYTWRFSPPGNRYFTISEVFQYFKKTLKDKGGITPEISKKMGW